MDEPDRAGRSAQSDEAQLPLAQSGGTTPQSAADISEVMGQVARELQQEHGDVGATLEAITRSAVTSVPGADDCGITLVTGRRKVESRAPTGDMPREVDVLQDRLGEGPCLDAIYEQVTVRIDDLGAEERWPSFTEGAAGLGIGSMLSFQLFVTSGNLGALNLYARHPRAFTEESESVGLVFASHAAIALAGAQQEQRLRTALDSRELIGQAQGILMERHKLTGAQAFTALTRVSSHTNRKLVEIAEELVSTGEMPHVPRTSAD